MKKYIKILMNKVDEFEKEKQLHNDTIALTIIDAKINSLKWAIHQANVMQQMGGA